MSNKIGPSHFRHIEKADQKINGSARSESASATPSAAGDNAAAASGNDSVVLTDRAQLLERLEKIAASTPAFDEQRVAAVKADIANGNYHVDVDKIAEILLRTEHEFDD